MIEPVHIAIFLPSLGGGGAERIVLVLAEEFARLGMRVDIVLVHYHGEFSHQVKGKVNVVDLNASRMFLSLPKLVRYLRTSKPDILLSTIDLANIIAYLAVTFSPNPPVWVLRQANYPRWYVQKKNIRGTLRGFLFKSAFARAAHTIAISKDLANHIQDLFHVPHNKISTVYNPAYYAALEPSAREDVSHPWFQENKQVIISVGRLNEQKDFPTLIKAFKIVYKKSQNARLIIAGEGSERHHLMQLIKELNLDDIVSLPGFLQNPFSYMHRSQVFVLPSLHEGFGNVLVEAMACGCPVVSTDCPSGPREILKDGEYGHLVPVGDAAAMAAAILDVLDGHGKAVPAAWLEQFRPEIIARQYIEIFQSLLHQRNRKNHL
jgi:glycosyltransferase involved in cell wall biosynthesis